jgi:N-acetylmuramoyl-L-alanine amidase
MPAVLVECAFMMIPEQEAMLRTDKFQRKCAAAILKGIKDYLRE